jgi:hypothetical protein
MGWSQCRDESSEMQEVSRFCFVKKLVSRRLLRWRCKNAIVELHPVECALPQQYVLAFLVYKVDDYFDLSFTTSAAVLEPSDDEVNGLR